jgi:hypothetical protein
MLKVLLISQASFGAQDIYYTQNNHNEFNFMEIKMIFFGAQWHQNNAIKM